MTSHVMALFLYNGRMRRIFLMAALALVAGGCIWNRAKVNDASVAERVAQVVPGKTRAADLPRILGAEPTAVIPLREGQVLYGWAYGDAKTEGFSLILLTLTKTNSAFASVYVLADAQGVVRRVQATPPPEVAWETWPFGE